MPAPVLDATSGLLAFIRYGFMPNHLGYCGGNDQDVLFEHAVTGRAERGLAPLLAKFTGAVPYLRTIAAANGIADPFDRRVVDGAFVLEVAGEPVRSVPEVARVRAVRWDFESNGRWAPVAAPALVQRLPAGDWRLEWEAEP